MHVGGGCVCLCMHVHVCVCACVGVCMHARMTHFLASICLRGPVVACSIHVHGLSAGVINDAIITPGWRSYTRKADYSYPMEECPVFDLLIPPLAV